MQLNDALALAHHLSLAAVVNGAGERAAAADDNRFPIRQIDADKRRRKLDACGRNAADGKTWLRKAIGAGDAGPLEPRSSMEVALRLPYLAGLPATRPYYSRPSNEQPFYDLAEPALRNAAETPAPIVAHASLDGRRCAHRAGGNCPFAAAIDTAAAADCPWRRFQSR